MLTLFQSSISCCGSVMENGFDKYAHVAMCRVLSTNNTESQALQMSTSVRIHQTTWINAEGWPNKGQHWPAAQENLSSCYLYTRHDC